MGKKKLGFLRINREFILFNNRNFKGKTAKYVLLENVRI
jgi:hypothetical protein